MQNNLVTIEGVSFSYGVQKNLQDIYLTLEPGEITCLLGQSGSGKTTLLQLCSGLLQPQSGNINAPFLRPGAEIGYMQQNGGLLPWRKAWQNVVLGNELLGKKIEQQQALEALKQVGLTDKAEAYPSELSGGQQQRVALARQLVMHPRLLLLDEPLGALDIVLRQELAALIKKIVKDNDIAALVVTHSPDEAIFLADQLCILGGTPAKITHRWQMNKDLDPKTAFHSVMSAMQQDMIDA